MQQPQQPPQQPQQLVKIGIVAAVSGAVESVPWRVGGRHRLWVFEKILGMEILRESRREQRDRQTDRQTDKKTECVCVRERERENHCGAGGARRLPRHGGPAVLGQVFDQF